MLLKAQIICMSHSYLIDVPKYTMKTYVAYYFLVEWAIFGNGLKLILVTREVRVK